MKNKMALYIIAIVILFFVPLYTVYDNYDLLINGKEYLFKVQAFDPYDMFRGKYLNIDFKENIVKSSNVTDKDNGYEDIYVEIVEDNKGFAKFVNVSKYKPNIKNYYKTKGYYSKYTEGYRLETPNRYYMNEKKSVNAEKIYNEHIENAYVKVKVKNGKMVIAGVYVNDILIDKFK